MVDVSVNRFTASLSRHSRHTNDERNHRGSISPRSLKPLDQLLYFPDLNILLGLIGLRGAHGGAMGTGSTTKLSGTLEGDG